MCRDLETVLTHTTVDWLNILETAQVRLIAPHRIDLPLETGNLLNHLFPGSEYKSVEVELEFGQGNSGTQVFLVDATRSDGSPELPAVIKMGPLTLISTS